MDDRKLREADNKDRTVVKSAKEGKIKFEWATETTKKNEQRTKRHEWTTETTKKKPQKRTNRRQKGTNRPHTGSNR